MAKLPNTSRAQDIMISRFSPASWCIGQFDWRFLFRFQIALKISKAWSRRLISDKVGRATTKTNQAFSYFLLQMHPSAGTFIAGPISKTFSTNHQTKVREKNEKRKRKGKASLSTLEQHANTRPKWWGGKKRVIHARGSSFKKAVAY